MALDWKLTVWPATGGESREILRDFSNVLGGNGRGLRLQITPEGECREAVFSAKGAGIQIPPLSAVQVSYLYGSVWTPIFFGEVRRGGNARDVLGEDYALRGMSRAFSEITLSPGFSTPEQAAHLTVRAIIQDAISGGDLGSPALVEYVEALCPDLGFNCRKITDAVQQNPAALLNQIAEDGAKYGVIVRWGVDPQRRFFCRVAKSDTRDVTYDAPVIRWSPPVAETPWTAVLWYLRQRKDKGWLTHRSEGPDVSTYRARVKPLSVDGSVKGLLSTAPTLSGSGGTWYAGSLAPADYAQWLLDEAYPAYNRPEDGNVTTGSYIVYQGDTTTDPVTVTFTLSAPAYLLDVYVGIRTTSPTDPDNYVEITTPGGVSTRVLSGAYGTDGLGGGLGSIRDVFFSGNLPWPAGTTVTFRAAPIAGSAAQILFYKVRPQAPNAALLDGLAGYHYAPPAQEPADIQTVVFVPPSELPGRVRVTPADGVPYEHPLEAVEYRITSNGMQMGWLAGQADDPNALAQASLIKRRDGEAVITSITAQT